MQGRHTRGVTILNDPAAPTIIISIKRIISGTRRVCRQDKQQAMVEVQDCSRTAGL